MYMEHLETQHSFVGSVSFKCHFCPEKFPTFALLKEHSKRYVQQVFLSCPSTRSKGVARGGRGARPPPKSGGSQKYTRGGPL